MISYKLIIIDGTRESVIYEPHFSSEEEKILNMIALHIVMDRFKEISVTKKDFDTGLQSLITKVPKKKSLGKRLMGLIKKV